MKLRRLESLIDRLGLSDQPADVNPLVNALTDKNGKDIAMCNVPQEVLESFQAEVAANEVDKHPKRT